MTQTRHNKDRIELRGGGVIWRRKGVWYVDFTVGAEPRQRHSLKTADARLAKEKAELLVASAHRGDMDKAMASLGMGGEKVVTLAEIGALYTAQAKLEGITARTAATNLWALGRLVSMGTGRPAENCTVADLSARTMNAARAAMLAGAEDGPARKRRDRSIASMMRQARSVFSPAYRQAYPKLPEDVEGFLSVSHKAEAKRYERPPEILVERTHAAAARLKEEAPALYAVYLLGYRLGMRPGEIATARWSWVEPDGRGGHALRIQFKRRTRRVPVSPGLLEELRALGGEDFLLPAAEPWHAGITPEGIRKNLVEREFAGWMRGLGWMEETYPKAAYELRKLAGSRWYTELGAERTAALLGHGNVAVTCQFYAVLDRPITAEQVDGVFKKERHHAG